MIDVWSVLTNSLWILGLAILLAVLSWAHWGASLEGVRFRTALGRPEARRVVDLGLVLFCAGLAASNRTWWERILWGLLGVVWLVQGLLKAYPHSSPRAGYSESKGAAGDQGVAGTDER